MPRIEYEDAIDEEAQEWLRVRITTEGGEVVAFTVQYETTIDGKRVPVARFDGAHGFAHRDLLDRRGRVIDKHPLADEPTFKQALQLGQHNLLNNWRRYRADFLKVEP